MTDITTISTEELKKDYYESIEDANNCIRKISELVERKVTNLNIANKISTELKRRGETW